MGYGRQASRLELGKEWRPREGMVITRVCMKVMQKEGDCIR